MKTEAQRKAARKWAFAIGGLALAFLLIASPVFADYGDNFDTYTTGTQNPGPWTFSATSADCYSNSAVDNIGSFALSAPNTYTIAYDHGAAGCSDPASGYVYFEFTAIANSVTATMNFGFLQVSSGSLTSASTVQVLVCPVGNLPPGGCIGGNYMDISGIPSTDTYVPLIATAPVTTGQQYWLVVWNDQFDTGLTYTYQMDNFYMSGGNVYISPSDINLYQTSTEEPFNVTADPGTSVQVQYSGPVSCTVSGLTGGGPMVQYAPNVCQVNDVYTSYLEFPSITSATLITVTVGANSYARTVIPSTNVCGSPISVCYVAIDPANIVVPYVLVVSDVSQVFVAGAEVNITTPATGGSNPHGYVITSGYLDAQDSFSAPLPIGVYTLTLTDGTHLFSESLHLGTVCSTQVASGCGIQILITTATVQAYGGVQSQVSYGAYYNCGSPYVTLYGSYDDVSTSTSTVDFYLYVTTPTTSYSQTSGPLTGPYGSAVYGFTISSYPSNANYELKIVAVTGEGTFTYGPFFPASKNPSCPNQNPTPSGFFNLPTFATAVFGLDAIPGLNNANAYSEIIALFVIILVAANFSARYGAFGLLATAFTAMWFFLALFLPFGYTFYYAILSVSVVGFLVYRRRRSAVLGQ
jgi:hypothetical protein